MATGYGPRSSRGLRTCAGCSWSGIGKGWHTLRCVAARDKSRPWRRAMARAHRESCVRARGVVGRGLEKAGILCGAWPHGTSCARGGGLMARAYRESCVRARGVVGRGLEGLSHGGEFGRAQCIWVGQNPRAGWGQGAVLGFLARLGGAETVLSGTVSSLALPKNWMQKTQEYQ